MQSQFPSGRCPPHARATLALAVLLSIAGLAQAAPAGGVVAAGAATIGTAGARTTITQSTGSAVINWQGFGIAAGEAVQFKQPGAGSVTLNRVVGSDPSAIFGSLSANGKVFLVNPNGVLFGAGASVNVGGLVASTLDLRDADFMAGRYRFSGTSRAAVVNEGTITADGGFVALLGSDVANRGVISTRLGNTVLAAGEAITLDVLGDNLLNVTIDRGAIDAAVRNGGLIQADGGQVLLTAQAVGSMLSSVVNNTGVIRAQTLSTEGGTIRLMADMGSGSVTVAGTLDASAPNGGNGGFIETSAAHVKIQDSARITTAAAGGSTGTWLIDPVDYTVKAGADISGAALSAQLVDTNVVIATTAGPGPGLGDITVSEVVAWNGATGVSLVPTTLTLNAFNDVHINAAITPTKGNLVVCCGRDVNVNAAITTVTGSVLLSAGRNVNIVRDSSSLALPNKHLTGITTTNGNIAICAAVDIILDNKFDAAALITLTTGSIVAGENLAELGVSRGLTLAAGTGGTGPGVAGGTLKIGAGTLLTITGPAGLTPIAITYNPVSYLAPTNYRPFFGTSDGAPFTSRMLVFAAGGDKTADGSTATTVAGLKGNPLGVSLSARPAKFDTPDPGLNKVVTFTDLTLTGTNAADFALPVACCGPNRGLASTTATLLAAVIPVVPVVVPPVPPVVVPVPVVIVAPPVVVVVPPGTTGPIPGPTPTSPGAVEFTTSTPDAVIPQFAPFVVAPMLLQAPMPLLVASPAPAQPMQLVLLQPPAPAPAVAPVPEAAPAPAPAPAFAPAVPAPAPVLRVPKPFRN